MAAVMQATEEKEIERPADAAAPAPLNEGCGDMPKDVMPADAGTEQAASALDPSLRRDDQEGPLAADPNDESGDGATPPPGSEAANAPRQTDGERQPPDEAGDEPGDDGFTVVDKRFWAKGEGADGNGDDDDGSASKPTFVQELEQQLADKDARLKATLEQHKDAVQEFENVKARLRRDVDREIESGKRRILAELLDVADNLERACEVSPSADEAKAVADGVRLVYQQLMAKLGDLGVKKLSALGTPFDPQRYDAISTVPVPSPEQDGQVVGVIKECYLVGHDVLRPGQVAVGKAADSE